MENDFELDDEIDNYTSTHLTKTMGHINRSSKNMSATKNKFNPELDSFIDDKILLVTEKVAHKKNLER